MAVVVMASPKGGCGKSTCAMLLAGECSSLGIETVLVDCDPTQSLTLWAEAGVMPEGCSLLAGVTEGNIVRRLREVDAEGRLVVVDLPGASSVLLSRAIAMADLVVTPMKASVLDARVGAQAINMVREEEEVLGRRIEQVVVLTMTRAVQSRIHRQVVASLRETGVSILKPELLERSAFSALFQHGGRVRDLPDDVSNRENARVNAAAFAVAVLEALREAGEGEGV